MTDSDKTVPVPVDLLKEIKRNGTYEYDYLTGAEAHLTGAGASALKDLVALIPSPPKVGDVLTAAQIEELPYDAIVVDVDGDSWLVRRDGKVLYFADADTTDNREDPRQGYEPYSLVYLPRD